MNFCQCGCGQEVIQKYNYYLPKYICGHQNRGRSSWNRGVTKSTNSLIKEIGRKISLARTSKHYSKLSLAKRGQIGYWNEKKFSPEHKQNLSKSHAGKISPMRNRHFSLDVRNRMSFSQRGKLKPEHSLRMKKLWEDPAYYEKQLKRMFDRSSHKQNIIEKKFEFLLNHFFPNYWTYVGDGKRTYIGRRVPDFINFETKKIIELYGDFYHRNEIDSGRARKAHFKKYNFDTLIIWEHELTQANIDSVIEKVRSFIHVCSGS